LRCEIAAGKVVMECVIETKASMILQFFDGSAEICTSHSRRQPGLPGLRPVKPHVTKWCLRSARNALLQDSNQNDRVDARKLSDLLYMNKLMRCITGITGADPEELGELSDHHP